MKIEIQTIYRRLYNFLLDQRSLDPQFTFTLRRTNVGNKIGQGYYFYGDDNGIGLSFWTGMDWQRKMPNICFYIDLDSLHCSLIISASDSRQKKVILQRLIALPRGAKQVNDSVWIKELSHDRNYLRALLEFLKNDKVKIDEEMRNRSRVFKNLGGNKRNLVYFIEPKDFNKSVNKISKLNTSRSKRVIPQSLSAISVKNFGPIKSLKLDKIPVDTQWIFLTGENGTGKTTVLKAVATALSNGTLSLGPRTIVSNNYEIDLTLHLDNRKRKVAVKRRPESSRKLLVKGFVAFGPIRLDVHDVNRYGYDPARTKQEVERIFNNPHLPLFNNHFPLLTLQTIYASRDMDINFLKNDDEKIRLITETLTQVVPGIVDIHFGRHMRFFEADKTGNVFGNSGVSFHHLASGIKSLIAMISHLMGILYYQQHSVKDPAQLQGIVLIDEIDIHFHPVMQKRLVEVLTRLFPRIQFIATTHSPIPLLGAPANSVIYCVKRNAKRQVYVENMSDHIDFTELLPNTLLTSPIFGLNDIFPSAHDTDEPIRFEDKYSDVMMNKQIEKNISEFLTPSRYKELAKHFSPNNETGIEKA